MVSVPIPYLVSLLIPVVEYSPRTRKILADASCICFLFDNLIKFVIPQCCEVCQAGTGPKSPVSAEQSVVSVAIVKMILMLRKTWFCLLVVKM